MLLLSLRIDRNIAQRLFLLKYKITSLSLWITLKVDGVSSKSVLLLYGVPEASVAWLFKFLPYTLVLYMILLLAMLSVYADDTIIYIEFDLTPDLTPLSAKSRLEASVVDISKWMHENKLQLNEDKTELVTITPYQQEGKVDIESVQVGGCDIKPAISSCNL